MSDEQEQLARACETWLKNPTVKHRKALDAAYRDWLKWELELYGLWIRAVAGGERNELRAALERAYKFYRGLPEQLTKALPIYGFVGGLPFDPEEVRLDNLEQAWETIYKTHPEWRPATR